MNVTSPADGPSYNPDPGKDHPAPTPSATPNIVHLVGLLLTIIRCGHNLLHKLVQPDAVPHDDLTRYYNTSELPLIVRYVLRGIMRAEALVLVLEARARRGRDVQEWAPRKSAGSKPPGERKKRDPSQPPKPPRPDEEVPFATALPDRKALLAWARRQSPGSALKAICLDLAVLKDTLGHARWREIECDVNRFGGNAFKLWSEITDRWLPLSAAASRKYKRRRTAAPPPEPEPATPPMPRVLMPLRDLLEPLLDPLRRSMAAA